MKRICHKVTASLAFLSAMIGVAASPLINAQEGRISAIDLQVVSDGIALKMAFEASVPQATSFSLNDPPSIVVDLSGASSDLDSAAIERALAAVGKEMIAGLEIVEDGSRARLVLSLDEPRAYTLERTEEAIELLVFRDISPSTQSQLSGVSAASARLLPLEVVDIGFERGDRGEALVAIEFSQELTGSAVSVQASKPDLRSDIQVAVTGAVLPAAWLRRFDASAFGTTVSGFQTLQTQEGFLLTIAAATSAEFVAYQQGSRYVVSVSPRPLALTAAERDRDRFAQYTRRVTGLSFQNIPVRRALFQLADFYDFNLVTSDSVVGDITLNIDDVPWDQALALILRMKRLTGRLEGNVLYVAPMDELAEQDQFEIDAAQNAEALAPLQTEFLQVNYASAEDILLLLVGVGSGIAAAPGPVATQGAADTRLNQGLLSPRGSASVDQRTNMLIVRDTEEKLREVRSLLATLDIAVQQVLIEARIVNVETNFGRELGIRWGLGGRLGNTRIGGSQATTTGILGAELAAADARAQGVLAGEAARLEALQNETDPSLIPALTNLARASVPVPRGVISFPDALTVDLGVVDPAASSFALGYARNSDLIELELSALESSGNGEVIARPKVTTQDKMPALIQSGVRIPYQSQAGGTAGGSTTEFEEAVLSLEVTPQITPDGRINMQLDIRQDSIAPGTSVVPAINTNQVTTRALVNNGETIVLGGVFREETATTESKTPVLGDLPYVGRLFKRSERSSRRSELLIFITPKILDESFE